MDLLPAAKPKLFLALLGSKAPARNVEQHDYFFGIATEIKALIPAMQAFWPEAGNTLHLDSWREVTHVDGYRIEVISKKLTDSDSSHHLYFINLGGYISGVLAEQHYTLLTVAPDKGTAVQTAKQTVFFKKHTIKGMKSANAHIDEKYGIDVDDIYDIEELLSPEDKAKFRIQITAQQEETPDEIILGYYPLHKFTI